MAASLVVDRLRLEIDMMRRDTSLWWLHSLPDITIQSLVQGTNGVSIMADILPSPELELPGDPTTIEFLVNAKYGSHPPVVRCLGAFVHGICDVKSRVVTLPMLARVERGWSKSYSIGSVLHTIRRAFMRKPSADGALGGGIGVWEIRSKYLQYMEAKHHIASSTVVVAHSAGVGCSSVGAREIMEDSLICVDELACGTSSTLGFQPALYCVADGHAGITCADYLMKHLPTAVGSTLGQDKSPREALYRAFTQVDAAFNDWAIANNDMSGSTCICVLYDGLDKLYCANVGDSRALLIRGGHPIQISRDHRSVDAEEQGYIVSRGGFITNDRTFGQLTVTRAFGDVDIKKQFGSSLCAVPEISEWTVSPSGDIVVLASDGLFAVMDNRTVATIVTTMLNKNATLQAIANELVRICVDERHGEDNTSVIVVEVTSDSLHDRSIAKAANGEIYNEAAVDDAIALKADKSVDKLLQDLSLQDDGVGVGGPPSTTKSEALRRPMATVNRAALQNDQELMEFLLDEQNFSS
ncbi:hypothetical protein H310_12803 [Aphanomyces invadans]|uniref:PPM-type phosphatase domain-containing protein n=1 Tax=Aphanomyces invadans TaxID=157072 RepID=A0A024TGR9_9STRA|nr:hypothetical protein H310_12803 [Aphanomyces invadans]ETV93204.1 hypothetical protein H310_12803 [Aphanomyces invadans]|eukprot:XP_008878226.1 hypothetical protein H310_12803 [Aphanomyces invadans]